MPGPIIGLGEILWDLLPEGRRAGGAPFNFAFHCHQLGHEAVIVSRVGDDQLGRELRAEVRRHGMTDEYIQTDPDRPTGTVRVEVDADGQPRYTIVENVAWDNIAWEERFEALLRSARAVCFGSLAQLSAISRATIRRFVGTPDPDRITIFDVNLRPQFGDRAVIEKSLTLARWVKMNEAEFAELSPLLANMSRPEIVCITRGERGGQITARAQSIDLPGIPIEVADTVGAGDAFTAGFLTQMIEGKPFAQSARFANALAALVASRSGGTPRLDRAEVERLC
jgi:fructokinase